MQKILEVCTFTRAIVLLIVLNVLDAASTHLALHHGIATELNPLMAWAYGVSPILFWGVKGVIISLALLILGGVSQEKTAKVTLLIMNSVYAAILVVHAAIWWSYLHG